MHARPPACMRIHADKVRMQAAREACAHGFLGIAECCYACACMKWAILCPPRYVVGPLNGAQFARWKAWQYVRYVRTTALAHLPVHTWQTWTSNGKCTCSLQRTCTCTCMRGHTHAHTCTTAPYTTTTTAHVLPKHSCEHMPWILRTPRTHTLQNMVQSLGHV